MDLPLWQTLSTDPQVLCEEIGECYFSVLSRAVQPDTAKDKVAHLDKAFKKLGIFKQLHQSLAKECPTVLGNHTTTDSAAPTRQEVPTLALFLRTHFRELLVGKPCVFSQANEYTNNTPLQVPTADDDLFTMKTSKELLQNLQQAMTRVFELLHNNNFDRAVENVAPFEVAPLEMDNIFENAQIQTALEYRQQQMFSNLVPWNESFIDK